MLHSPEDERVYPLLQPEHRGVGTNTLSAVQAVHFTGHPLHPTIFWVVSTIVANSPAGHDLTG